MTDFDVKSAQKLCCGYLLSGQREWGCLSEDQIRLERLTGGFSNKLYTCENLVTGEKVVIRLFGQNEAQIKAGSLQVMTRLEEDLVFHILGSRGCGPKLVGIIPDGRIEEYWNGHPLSDDDCRNPLVLASVARELAKFNFLNLDMPVKKDPLTMFGYAETEYRNLEEKGFKAIHSDLISRLESMGMKLVEAFEWFRKEFKSLNPRVVYCQKDMQRGNLLSHNDDSTRLRMVDMNFSCFGYRSSDIASFFAWIKFDPMSPSLLSDVPSPTHETIRRFIEIYLKEYENLNVVTFDPKIDDVDVIMRETLFFMSVNAVAWSVYVLREAETMKVHYPQGFNVFEPASVTYQKAREDYKILYGV